MVGKERERSRGTLLHKRTSGGFNRLQDTRHLCYAGCSGRYKVWRDMMFKGRLVDTGRERSDLTLICLSPHSLTALSSSSSALDIISSQVNAEDVHISFVPFLAELFSSQLLRLRLRLLQVRTSSLSVLLGSWFLIPSSERRVVSSWCLRPFSVFLIFFQGFLLFHASPLLHSVRIPHHGRPQRRRLASAAAHHQRSRLRKWRWQPYASAAACRQHQHGWLQCWIAYQCWSESCCAGTRKNTIYHCCVIWQCTC